MRVLLDGTPLLGARTGIGRYTATLLTALAERSDVDVSVVGFTARGWGRLSSAVPAGVRVTGLPAPARALRACWARGPFPPVELLARPADVVHATNFVLPPSARAAGVVTVHDLAFLDAPGESPDPALPDLVRRSVQRARVVCTPTEAVATTVSERLGVPRAKIVVTPLGVDPGWFEVRRAPDTRLPRDYLLFVGADGPRKRLDMLLRAHCPELPPLVVAGPGQSDPDGRVLRTGYLPDDELRRVVAGARALVLPSRDEGFGLPVLEALATGTPVVCSDIPALREVAGGHAELFSPDDARGLREALERALDCSRDATSDARRREHAAGFTWQACADATIHAYTRARHLR